MGARSYIPQLGRFLQPDPSPGGSANAYSYTYGNPLNETDLTGSETSGGTSAVGNGPAVNLEEGVGLGAGAIMPAPVNAQIEAEFEANPPWDQITAGTEEYEEEEEEGEEEYAAFGPSGNAENNMESGVCTSRLVGEPAAMDPCLVSRANVSRSCATICGPTLKVPCAKYADFLGIGKLAKKVWEKAKQKLDKGVESYQEMGYKTRYSHQKIATDSVWLGYGASRWGWLGLPH